MLWALPAGESRWETYIVDVAFFKYTSRRRCTTPQVAIVRQENQEGRRAIQDIHKWPHHTPYSGQRQHAEPLNPRE